LKCRQNPAFGPAHVRELTEIFVKKSIQVTFMDSYFLFSFLIKKIYQLRDIWIEEISKGRGQIDVLSWLSKMTLDVIGLAGLFISFVSLLLPCKPMPRL
jgi:hypothetical protein